MCNSNCRACRINGKNTACLRSSSVHLTPHEPVITLYIIELMLREKQTISSSFSKLLKPKILEGKLSMTWRSALVSSIHSVCLSFILSRSPSSAITFLYRAALSVSLKMINTNYTYVDNQIVSFPVSRTRCLFSRRGTQWPRLSSSSMFSFFKFLTCLLDMYKCSSFMSASSQTWRRQPRSCA